MSSERRIREFILTNFYVPDAAMLGDEDSLIDSGIVDSTGVLELILFLEQTFGIEVGDEEIVPENLDSIVGVAAFVAKKQPAAAIPGAPRAAGRGMAPTAV